MRRAQCARGCTANNGVQRKVAGQRSPAEDPAAPAALGSRVPTISRTDATLLRLALVQHGDASGGLPALLWRAGPGWRMISSAVLGGGLGEREWLVNAQVEHGYTRLDPARHLAEIAQAHGLTGPGVGLMTAARVTEGGFAADGEVEAAVTAGIGVHGWAAQPPDPAADLVSPAPGTINTVVALPVALSVAAMVNAVTTATEAKVQALRDAGFDASGTPTDAVCVAVPVAPSDQEVAFAGPRSEWGSRLARAVHLATLDAARRYHARRLLQE